MIWHKMAAAENPAFIFVLLSQQKLMRCFAAVYENINLMIWFTVNVDSFWLDFSSSFKIKTNISTLICIYSKY